VGGEKTVAGGIELVCDATDVADDGAPTIVGDL
jgi:hypothetical protein